MPIVTGPFHVVAVLLLTAGIAKLVRPGPTVDVARAGGLAASSFLVRCFALAEVAAGAAGIIIGGRTVAVSVAVLYLLFAGFVAMLMMRGITTAGCGCFGQATEEPPGAIHIAVDIGAGLIGIAAAVVSVPRASEVLSSQPAFGLPYAFFVAVGAWLLISVLTDLTRLAHATAEVMT